MTPFSSSPATAAAAGLGLAIYHLLCSDIERCADWTERAIAERHPAIFLFLVHAAGLRRLNVSLDALDPVKFKEVTRREGYEKVLEGIDAAKAAGFDPVKINAVSIRGVTEDEVIPFGHFARESGCEVRFIEYMPLDADAAWERDKVLFAAEILETLSAGIGPLVPLPRKDSRAPATDYEFADGIGRIGFGGAGAAGVVFFPVLHEQGGDLATGLVEAQRGDR